MKTNVVIIEGNSFIVNGIGDNEKELRLTENEFKKLEALSPETKWLKIEIIEGNEKI